MNATIRNAIGNLVLVGGTCLLVWYYQGFDAALQSIQLMTLVAISSALQSIKQSFEDVSSTLENLEWRAGFSKNSGKR